MDDNQEEYKVIGRRVPRQDSFDKVTGRTRFAADINRTGQLFGAVLHSEHPHAEILGINLTKAEQLEGVRAVVTYEDIPGKKLFGAVIQNQAVFAFDKTRYKGEAIAAVAADTVELAEYACGLIEVKYKLLDVLSNPIEGLKEDAPQVFSDGNLCKEHRVRKGDIEKGFKEADIIIEREYSTQRIEHSYIEPESAIAELSEDGGVRITGSIQNLFSARRVVSSVLNLPHNKVRLIQSPLGGSFGGKDETVSVLFCRAALLAIKSNRPVKLTNSRETSFVESYKRHPYFMKYKAGLKNDGTFTTMEIDVVADAGSCCSMSPFVTWRSVVQATGPYRVENVKTDVKAVYTNNNYSGAMRGFGSPQVNFAIESLLDEIAEELKINPLELRLKNCFVDGDITASNQRLDHKVSLKQVLEVVVQKSDYKSKWKKYRKNNNNRFKKGIGISCSYRGVSLGAEGMDAASVLVSIQSDGSVVVTTGLVEMGQGAATAISMIVAESLAVELDRIMFLGADTSRVPDSGPTVASRTTLMAGNAARDACRQLNDRLSGISDSVKLSFDEKTDVGFQQGISLYAVGHYKSPKTSWNEENGTGDAYFTFMYNANVAEVVVDTMTGKVNVTNFFASHDVGKVISLSGAEGQVTGGVMMGMGYALLEEYSQTDCQPDFHNFDEYLLTNASDAPVIDVKFVENNDKIGPFGAKCLGEPATEIAAPAIANAVFNATGKRIRNLPLTLERVMIGKNLSRGSKRGSEAVKEEE
ncbi:MAG: xanthine dehydrogenase family protein [candidate division Zixibacteria bacterium]|nr:xanthine dehydrogenase family protein [candidate division Zixibacteria bacterium]